MERGFTSTAMGPLAETASSTNIWALEHKQKFLMLGPGTGHFYSSLPWNTIIFGTWNTSILYLALWFQSPRHINITSRPWNTRIFLLWALWNASILTYVPWNASILTSVPWNAIILSSWAVWNASILTYVPWNPKILSSEVKNTAFLHFWTLSVNNLWVVSYCVIFGVEHTD